MMFRLILFVTLTILLQEGATKISANPQFKFSDFVKELTKKSRRRRSPNDFDADNIPLLRPQINPTHSKILQTLTRNQRANLDAKVDTNADIPCGSCQVRQMWVTIKKRSCKPVKILVPACQGLCASWEVRLCCCFYFYVD